MPVKQAQRQLKIVDWAAAEAGAVLLPLVLPEVFSFLGSEMELD